VVLGILISVVGTLFSVSPFLIWSFMALGTLSVTAWLSSRVVPSSLCVFFLVSVLGGMLFLCSIFPCWASPVIYQCALTLKLGLAPFHFWVFNLLRFLSLPSLCFFLGPAKFGLLYILVSSHSSSVSFASCSLLLGLSWLWQAQSASLILYSSGSCQLIIFILLGPSFFVVYFFLYSLSLFSILCISYGFLSPLLAFLCLAGLPPLTMFSAKLLALNALPFAGGVLLIFISVLSFYPYISYSLGMRSRSVSSPLVITLFILLPLCVVYIVL